MFSAKNLRQRLINSGLCPFNQLNGCSEKEIKNIEEQIGYKLPHSYRELMRVMGKGAGEFMSDMDMFYPNVLTLTNQIRKLISAKISLPANAFVFADRFGDQSFFFHLEKKETDPAVYQYYEDDDPDHFSKVAESLWDFVESELNAHESLLR